VEGFLEKNKDTLYEEHLVMLRASTLPLLALLFDDKAAAAAQAATGTGSSGRGTKATVGAQFQQSLGQLMATLNATEPHYVRCIKPNDAKQAFGYNRPRVIQQLRACGVLETIRISAAGYPSRWVYDEFLHRYRLVGPRGATPAGLSAVGQCQRILQHVIADGDA